MNDVGSCKEYAPQINVAEYTYDLPDDRIAAFPLAERDESRLLHFDGKQTEQRQVTHRWFHEAAELIPENSLLIMNNSRVILARIPARKQTGGAAEILFLEPVRPSRDPARALASSSPGVWNCVVGGKRIKEGDRLNALQGNENRGITLDATILSRNGTEAQVALDWSPKTLPLASVLQSIGELPLPPYLKRTAVSNDLLRYQTVYASQEGSVAAPTAGLHFTPRILARLRERAVTTDDVTLHVGAGTFRPMNSEQVSEHEMHEERISVSRATLERVRAHLEDRSRGNKAPLIAVGTTSLRTLESIAIFGSLLLENPNGPAWESPELRLGQWEAYRLKAQGKIAASPILSVDAVLRWLDRHGLDTLTGETRVMVVPGFPFQLVDALFTNFHQPGSTLILLVAAFVGPAWRQIYAEALSGPYRFLSYGDSSLLVRS